MTFRRNSFLVQLTARQLSWRQGKEMEKKEKHHTLQQPAAESR